MEVILADNYGFCFGVKRAFELAIDTLKENNENVYSLGPLVHNSQVVSYLQSLGLTVIHDLDDIAKIESGKVISRSHGITKDLYRELENNKKIEFIDATCQYVKSIHKKVEKYYNDGFKIIIVGNPNHPEVIGINSWCDNSAYIIQEIEDTDGIPFEDKDNICIVSQTTNTEEKFKSICDSILKKYDSVKIFNTICNATKLRQNSCANLAKKVDAMIIIGGYHSSNTNKLVNVCKKYCDNVYHIETINDLEIEKLKTFNKIGISAGASTPEWIIKEVLNKMDNINKDEMLKAIEDSMVRLYRGDIVKGKIISVRENEIMVNVGYKSDGIIKKEEISNDPDMNPKELYNIGDEIEVYVLKLDDGEGNVLLSIKRVEDIKAWGKIEKIYNEKEIVTCKVIEAVKGGVIALIEGQKGFIPASLLSVNYVKDLNSYVGKHLNVNIIEFDRNKKKIIISRKEVEKEEIKEKKKKVWESIDVNQVIEGTVKNITNFGAFVDLGGVDGLIHISDLSWNRVRHPEDVVKEGENIKVKVLDIDKDKEKISLGLKQILPEPWKLFEEKYKVGDIVEGTVVNILDFGAFVRLDVGVDGLVHVSQISDKHVAKPSDVLNVGDKIKAKIINIKSDEKKISLSMKEVDDDNYLNQQENNNNDNEEDLNITIEDIVKEGK